MNSKRLDEYSIMPLYPAGFKDLFACEIIKYHTTWPLSTGKIGLQGFIWIDLLTPW